MFDRIVVGLDGSETSDAALQLACGLAKAHGIRIVTPDEVSEIEKWLDDLGADGVLIRPDRYVFGQAHGADQVTALMKNLSGYSHQTHPPN